LNVGHARPPAPAAPAAAPPVDLWASRFFSLMSSCIFSMQLPTCINH
jgi:hypothetical protein